MQFPPAIIVHSLADANRATAFGRPCTLLSAPGAASYAGCLWWRELLAAASFTGPSLLDCADAPGRAIEALSIGLPGVILTGAPPSFAAVAEIAAMHGAWLLAEAPEALDLGEHGAARRLAAWLAG